RLAIKKREYDLLGQARAGGLPRTVRFAVDEQIAGVTRTVLVSNVFNHTSPVGGHDVVFLWNKRGHYFRGRGNWRRLGQSGRRRRRRSRGTRRCGRGPFEPEIQNDPGQNQHSNNNRKHSWFHGSDLSSSSTVSNQGDRELVTIDSVSLVGRETWVLQL